MIVSILPRLATGITFGAILQKLYMFLFFPVLRRGSHHQNKDNRPCKFLFFPVLRRGSTAPDTYLRSIHVSILPRLATGIKYGTKNVQKIMFLFFPVLRRGSIENSDLSWSEMFLFFPVLRRGSHTA